MEMMGRCQEWPAATGRGESGASGATEGAHTKGGSRTQADLQHLLKQEGSLTNHGEEIRHERFRNSHVPLRHLGKGSQQTRRRAEGGTLTCAARRICDFVNAGWVF